MGGSVAGSVYAQWGKRAPAVSKRRIWAGTGFRSHLEVEPGGALVRRQHRRPSRDLRPGMPEAAEAVRRDVGEALARQLQHLPARRVLVRGAPAVEHEDAVPRVGARAVVLVARDGGADGVQRHRAAVVVIGVRPEG